MTINKRFTQLNNSGSNHNLLDALSGKITGSLEVTGSAYFPGGLSGSLTTLVNGSPYIIGTGTVTVTSVSNGAITINGTSTSIPEYFYSATNNIIEASGSLYVSGAMRALSLSASNGMEVTGSAFFNDGVTLGSSNADIITVNGQLTASSGVAVTGYAVFNDNVTLGSSNADVVTVNAKLTASAGLELTGSSTFAAGSTFTFNGNGVFTAGLSGSLQMLTDGTTMFLTGGPGITITNQPNGQIAITGSAPEYWDSTTAASIFTTGSVLIRSDDGSGTDAASDYGADTFFFVSGAIDGVLNGNGVAAFGGDVVVSGNLIISGVNSALTPSGLYVYGDASLYRSLYVGSTATDIASFNSQLTASAGIDTPTIGNAGGNVVKVIAPLTASVGLEITGSSAFAAGSTFTFNGNGVFAAGLTGSLQEVSAGVPYLLAGDYITLATNSLGQIEISASNLPGTEVYWQSDVPGVTYATGSIYVSGSATFNPAGTGRGLLRVGGLDIGPITGSLYMTYTDGTETGIIGGSVLSASNGVWNGTNPVVLRHEVHVLGLGYGASEGGPTQMFAATYLVMSYIDSSGVQAVQAVTEVSRETSGSLAAGYDINFASNGNIEASASLDYAPAHVVWYAQRVKEMSLSYDLTLT